MTGLNKAYAFYRLQVQSFYHELVMAERAKFFTILARKSATATSSGMEFWCPLSYILSAQQFITRKDVVVEIDGKFRMGCMPNG
uniref:Uncharacterized protein n=1 Tax=Rhodnius prolixus TaxID=13249 RepID=T1HWU6_RHOPR